MAPSPLSFSCPYLSHSEESCSSDMRARAKSASPYLTVPVNALGSFANASCIHTATITSSSPSSPLATPTSYLNGEPSPALSPRMIAAFPTPPRSRSSSLVMTAGGVSQFDGTVARASYGQQGDNLLLESHPHLASGSLDRGYLHSEEHENRGTTPSNSANTNSSSNDNSDSTVITRQTLSAPPPSSSSSSLPSATSQKPRRPRKNPARSRTNSMTSESGSESGSLAGLSVFGTPVQQASAAPVRPVMSLQRRMDSELSVISTAGSTSETVYEDAVDTMGMSLQGRDQYRRSTSAGQVGDDGTSRIIFFPLVIQANMLYLSIPPHPIPQLSSS